MDTTIAYSHKGGFWKTKYSFISSWFGRIGRSFYSAKSSPSEEPVWKHNSDTSARTSYYQTDPSVPVIGSGMSVTFNKNVSQNKIYKSFSLEGTNNISGSNSFVVNDGVGNAKYGSIGSIKEKGGLLYGHIGQVENILDGSSMGLIGEITSEEILVDPLGEGNEAICYMYMRGSNLSIPALTTKAVLMVVDSAGSTTLKSSSGTGLTITPSTVYSGVSTSIIPSLKTSSDIDPTNFTINGGVEVRAEIQSASSFKSYVEGEISAGSRVFLNYLTPGSINGAPPRGQFAQLNLSLGSEPFELYAMNLNYEPTDLDHTK